MLCSAPEGSLQDGCDQKYRTRSAVVAGWRGPTAGCTPRRRTPGPWPGAWSMGSSSPAVALDDAAADGFWSTRRGCVPRRESTDRRGPDRRPSRSARAFLAGCPEGCQHGGPRTESGWGAPAFSGLMDYGFRFCVNSTWVISSGNRLSRRGGRFPIAFDTTSATSGKAGQVPARWSFR